MTSIIDFLSIYHYHIQILVLKNTDYLDDGNIWRNKDIFDIPASLKKYALKFGTQTITNKLETSTTKEDMFALRLLDTETKPRFRFFMNNIAQSIDCYKARLAINDFILPPQNGFSDWRKVNFFNYLTFEQIRPFEIKF